MSGGKGGGASIPKVSTGDVETAAHQQNMANRQAAWSSFGLSNPFITSPYGTVSYSPAPGASRIQTGLPGEQWTQYQQDIKLSPEIQALFTGGNKIQQQGLDIANALIGAAAPTLSKPLDLSGLGEVPGGDINALTDAALARMAPQIEADRTRLEGRLANQGLTSGSAAWSDANRQLERNINDARLGAVQLAPQEQARQMQSRQQQIAEILQERQQPLNEALTLLGAAPVQLPQQQAYSPVNQQPTNVTGLYQNMWNQNAQAAAANSAGGNSMLNGLIGLGGNLGSSALLSGLFGGASSAAPAVAGGALAFSDRRLKTDVVMAGSVDTAYGELPIYLYRIGDRLECGVMADEVMLVAPHFVHEVDGMAMVDYGGLFR